MPLFEGTVASTGLSKPTTMSDILDKRSQPYGEACFTYDPRGKDGAQFILPWSNSKASLLDGRSSVSHLSGMEAKTHIMFRQDSNSSKEGQSHSSPLQDAPINPGFTLYSKSPRTGSPTIPTSVAVRKQKTGSENPSHLSENPVYLAIPKPVYRHNPCCNELGCTRGRYGVEHGFPGRPHAVFKHNWMQTDPQYSERPAVQKNAQDTLLQPGGLQFQPSAERLKTVPVDPHSPGRAMTWPAFIDPNYSSYPWTVFGSFSEQGRQTSPRSYPSLYPSHHPYEHMTSEVYQEHSPMTKYGHLTRHPMFYYSQADVEVENRTQCKDTGSKPREDVPVIIKQAIPTPREHYMVPQMLQYEIPSHFPRTELPHHSLIRGFGHPCYAAPRFHLNARQRIQTPPSLHPNHITVPPASHCIDYHITSATGLHKEKPTTRLLTNVDQSNTKSAFLHVKQRSPTHLSHPFVSPSSINRIFPPLSSLNVHRPGIPTAVLNMERFANCSPSEAQVRYQKLPRVPPVSSGTQLPQTLHQNSNQSSNALILVHDNSNDRKNMNCPDVTPGSKDDESTSRSSSRSGLKRSHPLPQNEIKEEGDSCEAELLEKRRRVEMETIQIEDATNSPPMPVIHSVFSLAPHQVHLKAPGVLIPGRIPHRNHEVKIKSDFNDKSESQEEKQAVGYDDVKELHSNISPTEILSPRNIKVEKDASDTDSVVETLVSQQDCTMSAVNNEPVEADASHSGFRLVIRKRDPDEPLRKPSLSDNETSDESKPGDRIAQKNPSLQSDEAVQPKSGSSPQPTERRLNFRNIPPHCLKLSTFKIILPDEGSPSPGPPQAYPYLQSATEKTNTVIQMPVRKHFYELHHSLYKLISKSVFSSSEEELRTWLSQLEISDTTSANVKKVSCLLGVKVRELWLNEEIRSVFFKLLHRLNEYAAEERCPFPHVMRTGAVFLPMLVVKEQLFPMVQSNYIDQVLQEHKVELRPTTLSEEKILLQLHKRACSSRLRKLMSLKHLPDIYADVINLLYYTCVSKHLGKCMTGVTEAV